MNHTFPCKGTIRADLRVGAGRLEVVASERDTATVSVSAMDATEASAEAVRETKVDFKEGGLLLVQAPEHGWRLFRRAKLLVRVELPTGSALALRIASADADCTGAYHDVVVHTASGDVSIGDVAEEATVNTASGNIRLGAVGGHVRINSASGDLRLRHVARTLTVHTASGDVEVGAADGDVKVNTASGDISLGVTRSGEVKINSASGDITVGVAAGTGVWLDLSTASGRTSSELSMGGGGPAPTGAVTSTLTLKARTASGDISLRRVTPA